MCLASGSASTLADGPISSAIPRGHRLHVAAVGRPDQQRGRGAIRGTTSINVGGGRSLENTASANVLDEQPRSVDPEGGGVELLVLLSRLPRPGTLGDHRGDVGVLGRRLQHLFGADREADAADPGRVDVGPGLEEVDSGMRCPASRPSRTCCRHRHFTHSSTVQQQHAVAVPREHPRVRLRHVPAVEGDDRGAVLRRHVPARELEAVAGGDGDVLVRRAQVRRRTLATATCVVRYAKPIGRATNFATHHSTRTRSVRPPCRRNQCPPLRRDRQSWWLPSPSSTSPAAARESRSSRRRTARPPGCNSPPRWRPRRPRTVRRTARSRRLHRPAPASGTRPRGPARPAAPARSRGGPPPSYRPGAGRSRRRPRAGPPPLSQPGRRGSSGAEEVILRR